MNWRNASPLLDHVFLAFQTQAASFLGPRLTTILDEVRIGDGFRADKATLEIRMDDASRLRRSGTDFYLPGANLLDPSGEVGLQTEQAVTRPDDSIQARLLETHVGQERIPVGVIQL